MSLAFASSDQTIATFERNISQQCWPSICKRQQNDRNVSTQQMARLLGVTSCARLACRVLKIELVRMPGVQRCCTNQAKRVQHHATSTNAAWKTLAIFKCEPSTPNMSQQSMVAKRAQHAAPNNVAICCVEMLCRLAWS